jgi:hypothetical protein
MNSFPVEYTPVFCHIRVMFCAHTSPLWGCMHSDSPEKEFFIDNLLVRIHLVIEMIWGTGLAPWEYEIPFPGSLMHHPTSLYGRTKSMPETCAISRLAEANSPLPASESGIEDRRFGLTRRAGGRTPSENPFRLKRTWIFSLPPLQQPVPSRDLVHQFLDELKTQFLYRENSVALQ